MIEIVLFNKKQADKLSKKSDYLKIIIAIIISSLILSIPTTSQPAMQTVYSFLSTTALLTATIILSAFTAKTIGAENELKKIINAASITMMLSLIIISLPAGIITLWLIPAMLHTQLFSNLLFSIIPFYNFLIFGWIIEEASRNKNETKRTITALISLTLIMLFYITLSII